MATVTQKLTLKHRGNLGLDSNDHTFEAGTQLAILKEWREHYLCKDTDGNVFNIRKEHINPD